MDQLSRRCPRGFRTAPRAAAAPSPRHGPERWLLLLAAAGTAWREKGRPWRWEACCWACASLEGCKGTALDLESRETRGVHGQFFKTIIENHQRTETSRKRREAALEARAWLLMFAISAPRTHLRMRAGLPKPSWEPAGDILLPNVQRTRRRVALRLRTPGLGWATWTSCYWLCSGASASLLWEKRRMTNSNKHTQIHSIAHTKNKYT